MLFFQASTNPIHNISHFSGRGRKGQLMMTNDKELELIHPSHYTG